MRKISLRGGEISKKYESTSTISPANVIVNPVVAASLNLEKNPFSVLFKTLVVSKISVSILYPISIKNAAMPAVLKLKFIKLSIVKVTKASDIMEKTAKADGRKTLNKRKTTREMKSNAKMKALIN